MRRALAGLLRDLRERIAPSRPLPVYHHSAYRLPLQHEMEAFGLEPRRADLALWALREVAGAHRIEERLAAPARWTDLARVHTPEHLDALTHARSLGAMFGVDMPAFPVDAVLGAVRRATGATLQAAELVLEQGGPSLNLLGGFHHAAPNAGGGFCPINDVAIAIATLRSRGFTGQVVVLDLDAHPPDGTAACLVDDADSWLGSLSGVDWGPLPDVDETVLPDADDTTYLLALGKLLHRAPKPALAFVLAGGDVLADDRHGDLGLTLRGARRRDRRVQEWLGNTPTVWLPAGGYHGDAWRVLASTGAVLSDASSRRLARLDDPLVAHYARVARSLEEDDLGSSELDDLDLAELFGDPSRPRRFLGFYTDQGIEHGLYAYGILSHLQRLGYREVEATTDLLDTGERLTVTGLANGERHELISAVLRRERFDDHALLYIEWLNLRHPLATFPPGRTPLPWQDVPGLGLAWEAGALMLRIAERLGLEGTAWRPAWFHIAWIGWFRATFLDPVAQGRFEALGRDLAGDGLARATLAVAEGRVLRDGEPYTWDPEVMVTWVDHAPTRDADGQRARPRLEDDWEAEVARGKQATTFTVAAPAG